jgi:hypothetical protein
MRRLALALTVLAAAFALTAVAVAAKPDEGDPPGQAKKDGEQSVPPGQAKQEDQRPVPPGQAKKDEESPRAVPPGQAGKGESESDRPSADAPGQANRDVEPAEPGGAEEPAAGAEPAPIELSDAAPEFGETVEVAGQGVVRVKQRGGREWTAVDAEGGSIPEGAVVDARKGMVTLSVAADEAGTRHTASFAGAIFTVEQPPRPGRPTELVLHGGDFAPCKPATASGRARAAAKKRKSPVVRRLWGNGKGRFRTRGRFAAATVRGTVWSVEDRCGSTVVKVHEGVVGVRDLVTRAIHEVLAGGRLRIAGPRPRARR